MSARPAQCAYPSDRPAWLEAVLPRVLSARDRAPASGTARPRSQTDGRSRRQGWAKGGGLAAIARDKKEQTVTERVWGGVNINRMVFCVC